ncbi:MAG: hypothetical protein S0880_22550, partial [Actinomycetota bacterium]|nr:hypothetical protein [Actinomycetota bacterium]
PGADHADGNGHGNGRSDPSAATEPAVPGHADDPADAPVGATDRDRSRPDVSTFLAGLSGSTLSLDELASVAGVDTELVAELERFGLVRSRRQGPNTVYDDEAVSITRLAAAFVELGLEPRHLRMYKIATERETGIFLQLVGPLLAQRSQPSRADAAARLGRLTGLGEDLRRVLVRRQITDYLGDD